MLYENETYKTYCQPSENLWLSPLRSPVRVGVWGFECFRHCTPLRAIGTLASVAKPAGRG
jgi:hypothetical protein